VDARVLDARGSEKKPHDAFPWLCRRPGSMSLCLNVKLTHHPFSDALELLLCFDVLTKLFVQGLRRI